MSRGAQVILLLILAGSLAALLAGASRADSRPVGPLPAGPTSTIYTHKNQLVAVALPSRGGGRVWRVARPFNAALLRQVSEANVGASVVLVFRTIATGRSKLSFGLTRGETAKAYEARYFKIIAR